MFLRARNHPGLADSLVRFLRDHGSQSRVFLESGYCVDLFGDDSSKKTKGRISFDDTVGALAESNVLVDEGALDLTPQFRDFLRDSSPKDRLATWLLSVEQTGPDPSCGDPDAVGPSGDLAHTITWYLDIDPSGPDPRVTRGNPNLSPVLRLREDTGQELPRDTFKDGTEWALFKRWASFLGLAEERPNGGLDPDPTEALRSVLPEVLTDRMGVGDFLRSLGARLPVFGGHLEESWKRSTGVSTMDGVKPSLANALLRLEIDDTLRLERGKDADSPVIFVFSTFDAFRGPEGHVRPRQDRYAWIGPGVVE